MRFYFDSSALLKLALAESQSAAMKEFVAQAISQKATCLTSQLGRIETVRALRRRFGPDQVSLDQALHLALDAVSLYPLDATVTAQAETVGGDTLRSLDAIHLATALVCRADALVTYDERLRWAAFDVNIPIVQPGGGVTELPDGWEWLPGSVMP